MLSYFDRRVCKVDSDGEHYYITNKYITTFADDLSSHYVHYDPFCVFCGKPKRLFNNILSYLPHGMTVNKTVIATLGDYRWNKFGYEVLKENTYIGDRES